jgi:hypothetical protein
MCLNPIMTRVSCNVILIHGKLFWMKKTHPSNHVRMFPHIIFLYGFLRRTWWLESWSDIFFSCKIALDDCESSFRTWDPHAQLITHHNIWYRIRRCETRILLSWCLDVIHARLILWRSAKNGRINKLPTSDLHAIFCFWTSLNEILFNVFHQRLNN